MSGNIQDKVVLITGGGSDIGAATARHLGETGARVAVAGRRKDKVEPVAAAIVAAGGQAHLPARRRRQEAG